MIRQYILGASVGLLALATLSLGAVEAQAQEAAASETGRTPATSPLVTSVVPQLPGTPARVDGSTAWLGLSSCERMVSRNEMVAVRFETRDDTTFEGADGFTLFRDAYWYELDRGETATVVCPTDDRCQPIPEENVTETAERIDVSVPMRRLTDFTHEGQCEDEDIDQAFFFRIYLRANIEATEWVPIEGRIIIDTTRPEPPTDVMAAATQNTLRVEFTPSTSTDTVRYGAVVSTTPFEGGVVPTDARAPRTMTRIRDGVWELDIDQPAGTPLYVAIAAQDKTNNYSLLTEAMEIVTVETIDFWDHYLDQGGAETGGHCSAAGGSQGPLGIFWPILLLGGFVLLMRRNRAACRGIVATGALVACAFAFAPEAHAQSPTHGVFEFKVGGYTPAIDAEFGGTGPYETFFGGSPVVLFEGDVAFYLWQGFGKLGLGFGAGYGRVSGPVLAVDDTELELEDTTSFRTTPLRASLLYRFDYPATAWNIPLVPVFKGGLDYILWRVTGADGETAVSEGVRGSGGKFGWHTSVGLHLLLNIFDPASAAAFDMNWGINGSYLFAEYMMLQADGFGDSGFDFSDNHFMFGLAFEF
ncbi:MAG: MXAN_2562 family outer membrane beta-barrel protein [Bradymonadaceae bacterium]